MLGLRRLLNYQHGLNCQYVTGSFVSHIMISFMVLQFCMRNQSYWGVLIGRASDFGSNDLELDSESTILGEI